MLLRQPKVYTHYAVVTVLRYVRYTAYLLLLKWLVVDLVSFVYLSNGYFSWVIGILPFERVNSGWFSELQGNCDI